MVVGIYQQKKERRIPGQKIRCPTPFCLLPFIPVFTKAEFVKGGVSGASVMRTVVACTLDLLITFQSCKNGKPPKLEVTMITGIH